MHPMWMSPAYKKGMSEGKEMEKEKKRRENGEMKEVQVASSSDFRCFDGQSSLGQELNFVYLTRATLQVEGIFPTSVYFHPKGIGF